VRMHSEPLIELFDRVSSGTPVMLVADHPALPADVVGRDRLRSVA
jgi:hypothetical protein